MLTRQNRNDREDRLDANETVFFSRQLEAIDPIAYMTLFAGLLGRRYIPLVMNISPLENVYTYRRYTIHGKPKLGAPHAKDHPMVSVTAEETSQNIKQIPVSYGWSVREIKQAAKYDVPLDDLTIQAAMSTVARKQDDMLAFGESTVANITGLLNHSDVDFTTPTTKTGGGTSWFSAGCLADEIVKDLNLMVAEARTALKQASQSPGGDGAPAFDRWTILLPSAHYTKIATTPRSTTSDTTILKYVLQNNPWIESIEEWWQCDTADSGTDPQAVCYPRNQMCVGALIPDEFTSLAPQEEGHDIVVPAGGSCGGTVIRYAVACRYMKNIGTP
jgi:hypothetical protein